MLKKKPAGNAFETHGLSIQAIKVYASDRTATGTSKVVCLLLLNYYETVL
jgi:hypothetical protein